VNIIGRNEDSNLVLCFTSDGRIASVLTRHAKKTPEEIREIMAPEFGVDVQDIAVIRNFTFTATLVPDRWATTREGCSIYFEDIDSPHVYRMTQRGLYELLDHLIAKDGSVAITEKGISGLFTFEAKGATLTITLYGVD